jgi:hypothetical protein
MMDIYEMSRHFRNENLFRTGFGSIVTCRKKEQKAFNKAL